MNKLFVSFVTMLTILSIPTAQVRADQMSVGAAISDLQYRMTVEWDQQDQSVKNEIFKSFALKIKELRQAGLTDDQLLESVAVQSGNPQSTKDLKALASYAKENHLSLSQIDNVVSQYASQANQTGAHWTGKGHHKKPRSGTTVIVVGVIAVIVIIAVIVRCNNSGTPHRTDNNNGRGNNNNDHGNNNGGYTFN